MRDAPECAAGFLLRLLVLENGKESPSPSQGGEERSQLTAASSSDLRALSGCWDLRARFSVWPCLTAAAVQLRRLCRGGSSWAVRPREAQAGRRARCKLHGGLPHQGENEKLSQLWSLAFHSSHGPHAERICPEAMALLGRWVEVLVAGETGACCGKGGSVLVRRAGSDADGHGRC